MRDGKIHKIETVQDKDRKEFRDKIKNEISNSFTPATKGNAKFTAATEVRKPADYETFDNEAVVVAEQLVAELGTLSQYKPADNDTIIDYGTTTSPAPIVDSNAANVGYQSSNLLDSSINTH